MNEYPVGNKRILKSIYDGSFDKQYAFQVLKSVDLNEPICDLNGYSTTYLYEAVSANNLSAVSFLLEHGADPNLNKPELICDCPLWHLQYIEDDQNWKTRYEIAKLFFQYGADPNLESEGETLYDYIVFKVYMLCDRLFKMEEESFRKYPNYAKWYKNLVKTIWDKRYPYGWEMLIKLEKWLNLYKDDHDWIYLI